MRRASLHQVDVQQHHNSPFRQHRRGSSRSTAGKQGYKGSRKSTSVAQMAAETAAKTAIDQGMREVEVMVKGQGQADKPLSVLQAAVLKSP